MSFSYSQNSISIPPYIKSVEFRGSVSSSQFPIVSVGSAITLEFDDLIHPETDYYYDIIHCDTHWNPSTLMKIYYLRGFDDQRIKNYGNSYNTLTHYSHYKLTIPNSNTSIKRSGNYMIKVKNDKNQVLFTRRFIVYEKLSNVRIKVLRSKNISNFNRFQIVNVDISPTVTLDNPTRNVHLSVLQNYDWNTAKTQIKPQYIQENTLVYRYVDKMAFSGGNEFLYFDTKTINGKTTKTEFISRDSIYCHQLYSDKTRKLKPYTYYEDINGDFFIQNADAVNSDLEADYIRVSFELKGAEPFQNIYIYGNFHNYITDENNKMHYDIKNKSYTATLLLKQGVYNYKYITLKNNAIKLYDLCGEFWQTENTYRVIVYYRGYNDLYDRVIGTAEAHSVRVEN